MAFPPFQQNEFAYFFQDDFRIRPDLNIQMGLRHQVQSNLSDFNNLAPRFALAYSPGSRRTVLTVGGGVFYERQSTRLKQHALLYDGMRIRGVVVHNPGSTAAPAADGALTPSVVRLAPDAVAPYLIQTSAGVERRIGAGRGYVALEFMDVRGLKLHRLRNVNAPLPGTGLRPDPRFININQFETSGRMHGQSMRIIAALPSTHNLEFQAQYKLSRTRDDTGGAFSLPANNYDLHSEYGRADFDRRHDFVFLGIYRLPRRTRLGVIAHLASGMSYNITTGSDDNGDTVANDRPPGMRRNTGQGPGLAALDLRLSKKLRFGDSGHWPEVEVRADAFNVLNRVNFTRYIGTLSSPFFGRANAALPAREVQLSLKLEF